MYAYVPGWPSGKCRRLLSWSLITPQMLMFPNKYQIPQVLPAISLDMFTFSSSNKFIAEHLLKVKRNNINPNTINTYQTQSYEDRSYYILFQSSHQVKFIDGNRIEILLIWVGGGEYGI